MLSSITPLGERTRHNTYAITVGLFGLASALAGAAAGAVTGVVGAVLIPPGSPGRLLLVIAAAILAAGVLVDVGRSGALLPSPRRQVDERWLRVYRRWVYACGYGAQLGVGVATRVTSSGVYAMYVLALLSRNAPIGAAIIAAHGAGRAASLAAGWSVRTPADLMRMHAGFLQREASTRRVTLVAQAAAAAILALVAVAG